jgi:hypothetical protein
VLEKINSYCNPGELTSQGGRITLASALSLMKLIACRIVLAKPKRLMPIAMA